MEVPPVRYATTADGLSIAYLVGGEGLPLVFMPFHFNHVQRRWIGPFYARGLAECCRVHLYDSRGQGLSTRALPADPTVDDYRADLEAVVAANGLERFVMAAYGGFAHVAIRYAVEHPEKVLALMLICTSESFEAWPLTAMLPLVETNWELYLQAMTVNVPESIRDRVVEFQKLATTQSDYIELVRAFARSDVSDLIPRLTMPVLFLHSETQHWLSPEEGIRLAAKTPNSRLVFLKGDAEPDDVQFVVAALDFLRDLAATGQVPPAREQGVAASVRLSARQREVLQLLAQGRTTREIAADLVLSERTVQRHIADLYARIGVRNRAEATAFALTL